MKSIVVVFDMTRGEIVNKILFTQPPKKALIYTIMQRNENYNTWEYPSNLEGIYTSPTIKNRYYYDITSDLIMCSQLYNDKE